MLSKRLAQLSLCASAAYAFQDTSPLFIYSSSKNNVFDLAPPQQVSQSSQVTEFFKGTVGSCPSDAYIIVTQPGASSGDFKDQRSAPHLSRRIVGKDDLVASKYVLPEVIGEVDVASIMKQLMDKCGIKSTTQVDAKHGTVPTEDSFPQLITIDFDPLPIAAADRENQLRNNDALLDTVHSLLSSRSYTVLYTTTPTSKAPTGPRSKSVSEDHHQVLYDSEAEGVGGAIHMDLKRDMADHLTRRQDDDENWNADAPLFEKYNFLSPGIFMGLFASILLISILYVGMNAVGSLEVSYAAFSKEMGPKAQQGKQQ